MTTTTKHVHVKLRWRTYKGKVALVFKEGWEHFEAEARNRKIDTEEMISIEVVRLVGKITSMQSPP
jgi:hypothetical protein